MKKSIVKVATACLATIIGVSVLATSSLAAPSWYTLPYNSRFVGERLNFWNRNISGDGNGDGVISVTDATYIAIVVQKLNAMDRNSWEYSEVVIANFRCDANRDNNIDSNDVQAVTDYIRWKNS